MKKYIYILFAFVAFTSCSEDNNGFIEQSLFGQGSYEIPLPLPTELVLSFEGSLAYGTVLNGTSNPRQVIVNNAFNHPVNVSVSYPSNTPIISFNETNFQVPANGSYTLTVTYNPTSSNFLGGVIFFTYQANLPDYLGGLGPVTQSIDISGQSVAVLPTTMSYSPAGTLNFGTVANGDTVTRTITLNNTGNSTANWSPVGNILSFTPTSGTIVPGNSQNVVLSFTANGTGVYNNTQTFTFNGGNVQIPYTANRVAASRIINLSVNSTAFGNVQVNTTATKIITISNSINSNSTITITSVSENSSQFSVTNYTGVLQPGQSTQVTISFSPTLVGIRSTILNVFSNKTSGSSAINFSATAVN